MTNKFKSGTEQQGMLDALLQAIPNEFHAEVVERYAAHAPLLFDRLHQLYGSKENYSNWLSGLLQSLGGLFAARPDPLRELDRQRVQNPAWFLSQKNTGYCAYVDRLGGTLSGVQNRIPHLQQLGVTYLHLLPFLRTRAGENDGGFAVASFEQIEPALGSMQDLVELATALRAAGISLCSDFILNHVADSHPWALATVNGDQVMQNYFHTYQDRLSVDAVEEQLNQVFPEASPGNFTYNETLQRWVWTTFYPYQWDLNYSNPEVFAALISSLLNLANQGVEVFRLDSTAYIWKRPGTNCMNQPEVHWILQAMRSIVDMIAPAVLLKAEAIVATKELPAYLGGATKHVPECHLAYHSTLMAAGWAALATQNVDLMRKVMRDTPSDNPAVSWLTYVRCHDDIGWNVLLPEANQEHQDGAQRLLAVTQLLTGANGGFGRGENFQTNTPDKVHGTNGMTAALTGISSAHSEQDLQDGIRRMLLLYGLACCFGGIPMIYMGDELGQENDYTFLNDPARSKDNRWLQRPYLNQAAMQSRYDLDSKPGKIFSALCKLIKTRQQLPALAVPMPRTLLDSGTDSILAFARGEFVPGQVNPDSVIYLGNFSDSGVSLDMCKMTGITSAMQWKNRHDQEIHTSQLFLPAWSQFWLMPEPPLI